MKPLPAPFRNLTMIKKVRRVLLAIIGGSILVLGIALVALPGPAFLVIPAGLAILALECGRVRGRLRNPGYRLEPARVSQGSRAP